MLRAHSSAASSSSRLLPALRCLSATIKSIHFPLEIALQQMRDAHMQPPDEPTVASDIRKARSQRCDELPQLVDDLGTVDGVRIRYSAAQFSQSRARLRICRF